MLKTYIFILSLPLCLLAQIEESNETFEFSPPLLDGGEVNFSKSEKNREPCQLYLIENKIEDKDFEVLFEYCYTEQSVSVLNINVLDEDSVCSD